MLVQEFAPKLISLIWFRHFSDRTGLDKPLERTHAMFSSSISASSEPWLTAP